MYSTYIPNQNNDPFRKHLQKVEYINDIHSSVSNSLKTVYEEYKTIENEKQLELVSHLNEISQSNENNYNQLIENSFGQTMEIVGALNKTTESIIDLGLALDDRLKLILEQQRLSNIINYNISKLLQVPDFQKERKYYIDQGFKHFCNSKIDPSLIEVALDNFLKAEEKETTDYFVLYHIGIIYLYSHLYDPKKAEDYFIRSGQYALVESNPNAIIQGSIDINYNSINNESNSEKKRLNINDKIKIFSSEIYEQAAIAAFLQNRYKKAIDYIHTSIRLVPEKKITRFNYARFLAADQQQKEAVKVLEPLILEDRSFATATNLDVSLSTSSEVINLLKKLRDDANNELKDKIDFIKSKYKVLINRDGELDKDLSFVIQHYNKNTYQSAMEALDFIPELLQNAEIWLTDYNYTKKILIEIKNNYKELLKPNSKFASDIIELKNKFIKSKTYNSLRDVVKQLQNVKKNVKILANAKKNIEFHLHFFKTQMNLLSEKKEFKDLINDLENSLHILEINDIVRKNDSLSELKKKFQAWTDCIICIQRIVYSKKYPFLNKDRVKKDKYGLDANNYNDCLRSLKLLNSLKKNYEQDLKNEVVYKFTKNISFLMILFLFFINIYMISYVTNYYTPYDISLKEMVNNIFINNIYLIFFLSLLLSFCFALLISKGASRNEYFNKLYIHRKSQYFLVFIKSFLLLHMMLFSLFFLIFHDKFNNAKPVISNINKQQSLANDTIKHMEYNDKYFNKELLIRFDLLQSKITDFVKDSKDSEKFKVPKFISLNTALNHLQRLNSLIRKIEKYYDYEMQYQTEQVKIKYYNEINKMNRTLKRHKGKYETFEEFNSKQKIQKEKIESIKIELQNRTQTIQMTFLNSLNICKSNIDSKRKILTNQIFQIKSNNVSIEKIIYNPEIQEFDIDARFLINNDLQILTNFKAMFPIKHAQKYGENPELFIINIFVKLDSNSVLVPYKIFLIDNDNKKYLTKSIVFSLEHTYFSNRIMLYIIWAAFFFVLVPLFLLNRYILFICLAIILVWGIVYSFPYVYENFTIFKDIVEDTYDIEFKVYDPFSNFFAGICQLILALPVISFILLFIGLILFGLANS